MKLLSTVLPLGTIELTRGNVMIIIGVLALIFLLIGGKMAFGFMRTMNRISHQYGPMGQMMQPMMGGASTHYQEDKKGSGVMGTIAFAAALFLVWQMVLSGPQNKRSVNYSTQDSVVEQPLFRITTPSSKEKKQIETPQRRAKKNKKTEDSNVRRPSSNTPKFYNTSPSRSKENGQDDSFYKDSTVPTEESLETSETNSHQEFTVQVACGSNPSFVRDEAEKIQTDFSGYKISLYKDPEMDCIKILVGQFYTKNEAVNFNANIAKRLKKRGHVIRLDNIDETLLITINK